jgi:hypothetical protein
MGGTAANAVWLGGGVKDLVLQNSTEPFDPSALATRSVADVAGLGADVLNPFEPSASRRCQLATIKFVLWGRDALLPG